MFKQFILLIFLTINILHGVDVPMQAIVGQAVSIHDATSVGTHDPSQSQSSWVTLCSFQLDSLSHLGFELTCSLAGTGWSHYATGTTQGTDFNTFSDFRLTSSDSANYDGTNAMSGLPTWGTVDLTARTFTNGTQTQPIYNWLVEAQSKWAAAPSLLPGAYTQTLTVTIAVGNGS